MSLGFFQGKMEKQIAAVSKLLKTVYLKAQSLGLGEYHDTRVHPKVHQALDSVST